MKYIGIILLFFSFLLLGTAESRVAGAKETEKASVLSFGQESGRYSAAEDIPVLYGVEQDAGRFFSSIRSNWVHAQQHIVERTLLGLKRIICLASSCDSVLTQQQYALFNHRFLYSEKPCSLYYVYAIRRILI